MIFNKMVNYEAGLNTVFGALADPTRRAILARLARGEATVSELAEPFSVSLPAISRHLRILEDAGLLVRSREGRIHRLRLQPDPMKVAADWIERHRAFWEARLDALADYLKETTKEDVTWPSPDRSPGSTQRSRSGAPIRHRGKRSSRPGPIRKR